MKVLGCAALMLFATTGSKSPAIAGGFYVGVNGGGGLGYRAKRSPLIVS